MSLRTVCFAVIITTSFSTVVGEDVSGLIENPTQKLGDGSALRLIGESRFGWKTGRFAGDLDLNGHQFTMDTGGGNRTEFSGVISGTGDFIWNGGGSAQWQTTPSFLTGDSANTFVGTLTVLRGTLALAKPKGVTSVSGRRLVLGGGSNQAIIRLDASDQIHDQCRIVFMGDHPARFWTQGCSENVGPLVLGTHGYLDLGEGTSKLHFADSSDCEWDFAKTLTIQNWTQGQDVIRFGTNASGLNKEQLSRIGFADPSGRATGLYTASLLADGQLVPDKHVTAESPAFDVSPQARRQREKLYDVAGRELLCGEGTLLKTGMRISFFGDSITWQNNYIREIQDSLQRSSATKELKIQLINRGINGGGVLSLRDGVDKAAYVDAGHRDGKQAAFASVIKADQADVAVVLIGINDVWWRKTRPSDFAQALRDLVDAARRNDTRLVLATLTVYQERPDDSNPLDSKCNEFAKITRDVALATNTTLVDLRRVYLAYLRNHNAELRVDGTLNYQTTGVLTYDGVHPNAVGNRLLADHISFGIHSVLGQHR